METIHLDNYLKDGILIEKDFRRKVEETDWNIYLNKKVLIKGCASIPIPTWAYMIIASELVPYSKQILYGESCSAYKIYSKH